MIQHYPAIEENNMTVMNFQRIQPQQATSIYAQQTTSQQTSGIDISGLINLMMPVMIVGMIMKMMVSAIGSTGKTKKLQTAKNISGGTNTPTNKATTAGHAEPAT